MKVNCCIFRPK